jgi:hypothetical protein
MTRHPEQACRVDRRVDRRTMSLVCLAARDTDCKGLSQIEYREDISCYPGLSKELVRKVQDLSPGDGRVRYGNANQNLAILRHMALNLLKQEKTAKGRIKAKRLQAAWNEDYLVKVLAG